eukprot:5438425-Pyramimonas_sp.AAC.1
MHWVQNRCPNVVPRASVDDAVLQWIGPSGDSTVELLKWAQDFVEDAARFGFLSQIKRSEWVSTTASAKHDTVRLA